MKYNRARHEQADQEGIGIFRLDVPLLLFLLAGWSLIFVVATLGLRRDVQRWLPVKLVAEVSANYSADMATAPKLARVNPKIIEAVKQDAQPIRPARPAVDLAPLPLTPVPTSLAVVPLAIPGPGALVVSAGGPYQGNEGSPIALTARNDSLVLNLVPSGVTYQWDFNNDGHYDDAQGDRVSVIFYDEGEYTVGLMATDLVGRTATDKAIVKVYNVPPRITMGQDVFLTEGDQANFTPTVSEPGYDVLLYEWDFGDGSAPVIGQLNPSHTYLDNGTYTVHLRVTDNDGGVSDATLLAHVKNSPPVVDAGPDQHIKEGDRVTLSGTATDRGVLDTLTYAWDLNYDGQTFTPDVIGPTASTVYKDGPATIVAALRVQDNNEGTAIATVKVTVDNSDPVITAVSRDSPVAEGTPFNVRVSATDVGSDTLRYAFDWQNDGSFDEISSAASASHTWSNQGDYTVRIRVDDRQGGEAFTTTTVSAYNLAPTAVLSAPTTARLEGSLVTFNGSKSSDPGSADVLTYRWDFGDGTTSTSGPVVDHRYADNGVYSTTLTVTDDSGAASTAAAPVTILNANPTVNAGPDIEVNENTTGSNLISFKAEATDPGRADTLTYAWDTDNDGVFESSGPTVDKLYQNLDGPAEFLVTVRVRDDDYQNPAQGNNEIGEAIDTVKVTVKNMPPQVNAGGPYPGTEKRPVTLTGLATDTPLDILTYSWDLNDDGLCETAGRVVTSTWTTPGIYPVKLCVHDDDGAIDIGSTQVNINGIPVAAAVVSPTQTLEGNPVTFDGSNSTDADNDTLSYTWAFGDGSQATGVRVTHVYADNGTYTPILTVRDNRGESDTASPGDVSILNANPQVDAGPDQVAQEGVPLTLTGQASDPGTADTLTYAWDFDYDGQNFDVQATGLTATPVYSDGLMPPVSHTVALRVRDDDYPAANGEAGQAIDTLQVTVANLPPHDVDAGGPYVTTIDVPIILTGRGADVEADPLTLAWDFTYSGAFKADATGGQVKATWPDAGTYIVALRVSDKDGGVTLVTTTVTVGLPPIADAGGPYQADEGNPVKLTGAGSSDPDGDPLTYTWNFGDGSPTAAGMVVSHVYVTTGVYKVQLRVEDGQGGVAITGTTVTVRNIPPIAVATAGPNPAPEGTAVTFDGSGSTAGPTDTLTYQWNFGDGSTGQSNPQVTHVYGDNGVYTATLTVTDDDGTTATSTQAITVHNVPPTADAGGPYATTAHIPLTLSGSGSDVPADQLTFAWDLDGDGTAETPGQQVKHNWKTAGTYQVTLFVTDDDGGVTTATTTVEVNGPPTADAGGPYNGNEGSPVTLTGSGSDPENNPITYRWDLDNDGKFETKGQQVTYTWPDNGTYQVTLQVDDGRGGTATSQATVTIANVPPTADAGGPYATTAGIPLTLSGSGSDVPADQLTFAWDLDGDGTAETPGQKIDHTWAAAGTYPVTLVVTDDDGGTTTASTTVEVNGPPTADAGGPYNGNEGSPVTLTGSGSDPENNTLSYSWDLDNDGKFETKGQQVTYTWPDNGTYQVTLQVDDGRGGTATSQATVTIANVPPTADAGGPYTTSVGASLTLSGSGSDVPADQLTFAWDLDGDGTAETPDRKVKHTWDTAGTYQVTLVVTDDDGGTTTASTTVEVTP